MSNSSDAPRRGLRFEPMGGVHRYLGALTAFDRNVRLFLITTAVRGMVVASLQTVFNLYLYSLGYDARFIGLVSAVNSLAVLLVSVPLGYLADRFGRRPVLLVGGLMYPFSLLGLGLTSSTVGLMVLNFLFGAAASAYWVAGVPLLFASTREDQRVRAFSINSFLLWGFGPFGAFLSGQVVEVAARVGGVPASSSAALRAGMLFMGGLALLGAVPYVFLGEPRRTGVSSGPARARPAMARLLLPDLVLAFGLGAMLTFTQLYFHLRFSLDAGPIGLIMAIGGLMAGIGALLTPGMARRWGNLHAAVRFQWGAGLFMAIVALAFQLPVAVMAYWALIALRGMSDPVYTAFVQDQVPEAYRARLTGLYSVTYSIGYSLGPTLSGQIQATNGLTPAFLIATVCYLSGAFLLFSFFRRTSGVRTAAEIERA